jgi:hypothetical protein
MVYSEQECKNMEVAQKQSRRVNVESFTVEFGGDIGCSDYQIVAIHTRVRGRFSKAAMGADAARLGSLAAMPDVPGICLTLNPRDRKAVLFDPLENDPQLLNQVTAVWRNSNPLHGGGAFGYVKRKELMLGEHQFKTLVIEVYRRHQAGHVRVMKGTMPSWETIESMPGREIYDPGDTITQRKERYVDEVDEFGVPLSTAK